MKFVATTMFEGRLIAATEDSLYEWRDDRWHKLVIETVPEESREARVKREAGIVALHSAAGKL
jgi:hypothetical protein